MGGLFSSGTRQVQQQPIQTGLSGSEVARLSSITGQSGLQQQQAVNLKKRVPAKTVLGTPVQPIGNASPNAFGTING